MCSLRNVKSQKEILADVAISLSFRDTEIERIYIQAKGEKQCEYHLQEEKKQR